MDSGNSGSMQSSSGGGDDQEYDDSISPPNLIYNSMAQPNTINPTFSRYNYNSISLESPSLFNAPSEYLNHFSLSNLNQNQNALTNHEATWSRGLHLDQPSYSTLIDQTQIGSSSSMAKNPSILLASQGQGQGQGQSHPQHQGSTMLRPNNENGSRIMKNSKKRTRASRRAPTTVLTTDTSNFRAMVQEFTGIPAPPFSTAPSTFSRRFDLFGSGSSSIYPIRPNLISSPLGSSNTNCTATAATNNTNLNSNYELVQNIHNDPMLTFQSLLQPISSFPNQIKYDETNVFGTKVQGGSSINTKQNEERRMRNGNMNQSNEKGLEMINHGSSRGELGTVDTWICPSD